MHVDTWSNDRRGCFSHPLLFSLTYMNCILDSTSSSSGNALTPYSARCAALPEKISGPSGETNDVNLSEVHPPALNKANKLGLGRTMRCAWTVPSRPGISVVTVHSCRYILRQSIVTAGLRLPTIVTGQTASSQLCFCCAAVPMHHGSGGVC
jgi:hypothetical protein